MQILIDKIKYELPFSYNTEERLELVNNITDKYKNYFINNFEKNNIIKILDILGEYLCFGVEKEEKNKEKIKKAEKKEREKEIIAHNKLQWISKRKELPVERDSNFPDKFVERHNLKNPKKSTKLYSKSKIHKLNTIFIESKNRTNRLIQENPCVHNFYFNNKLDCDDVGLWQYESSDYTINIDINCFTKSDLKLPYIDKKLSYFFKWCYIDNDNKFKFCIMDCKLNFNYKYDFVLVLFQDKFYFLDQDINVINDIDVSMNTFL